MIPMTLQEIAKAVHATDLPTASSERATRVVTDSREVRPGDLFVAIVGERFDGHRYIRPAIGQGAVACIGEVERVPAGELQSSERLIPVADTIQALGDLAGYYRKNIVSAETKIIAVTGSNGKTTTKNMIHHVLSNQLPGRAAIKSFNNHIGVPLTLLSAEASDRYVVVEIGTNAPGEVASLARIAAPDVAVIASIGEAHLEGLKSLRAIAEEKASILDYLSPHGLAVVTADSAELRDHLDRRSGAETKHTFGFHADADLRIQNVAISLSQTRFELSGGHRLVLPLPGAHHALNAAAAWCACRWMELTPHRIIERLATMPTSSGRCERIPLGDITLIDDSYNANPTSMTAAVRTMRDFGKSAVNRDGECDDFRLQRRVMVLGDMLELGDQSERYHQALVEEVLGSQIELLIGVGSAMTRAIRTAPKGLAPSPERSHHSPPPLPRGDQGGCCHDAKTFPNPSLSRREAGHNTTFSAAGPGSTELVTFEDADSASEAISSLLSPGDAVWIKGSRRVALDRVVRRLRSDTDVAVDLALEL